MGSNHLFSETPQEGGGQFLANPKLRFMDQCREVMRFKRLANRTEEAYCDWIRRYIVFHGKRHPQELGQAEVVAFLTHLAVERQVAAPTQNQALSALLFLYREVVGVKLEWVEGFERGKTLPRVPVVLAKEEVVAVLAAAEARYQLILRLLYGTGMRLMEGLRLRVKDVDFARNQVVVRDGKGFTP